MSRHRVIHIVGAEGYPLQGRYWESQHPTALLVLLHGVVSHGLWLSDVAERLALAGIDCLCIDRRGAGLNDEARGDAPNEAALLNDVLAVLDWASSRELPVHVGGFCWGANYLINVLDRHKPSVESACLIAPSLFPSGRVLDADFVIGDSGVASETPVIPLEAFTDGPAYRDFILPDPLRTRQVSPRLNRCMAAFSQSLWIKFLRLKLPVFVALGRHDDVVDNEATERLFERLPVERKTLHVLPGRHGVQFDAGGELATALFDWIATTPSAVDSCGSGTPVASGPALAVSRSTHR